jgi:uncharacterized membrane protein
MDAVLVTAVLWMLFLGTHIGLATRRVRAALVARLGAHGFTVVYFLIAVGTFAALVAYYAGHRFVGPPGLALGAYALVRWSLMAVIVAGIALAAAGLAAYPRTPMALFDQRVAAPRGVERITRHSFFVGTALLALAHVVLAPRLIGTVFAAGLATLALAGAWHQDRKLLARRGESYRAYLDATSLLPFVAIAAGRQRLVAAELPLGAMAWGCAAAVALRLGHDHIFAGGGAWLIGALVVGAVLATVQSWRRARRHAAVAPAPLRAHAGAGR